MDSWGYNDENGPHKWHFKFPIALEGLRQSPINIEKSNAVTGTLGSSYAPFSFKYEPQKNATLENTGASWKLNIDGNSSYIYGGGLNGEYELAQIHAHWGSDPDYGSEHTVDGKSYAAEIHFVHWNRTKYGNFSEATEQPDGLAVLGVFVEACSDGCFNTELSKICANLSKIVYKNDSVKIANETLDPAKLLPSNSKSGFWRYEGSLTTPPLLECVIWTVFKEPIKASKEQLEAMRNMCFSNRNEDKFMMINNFRKPCPIGSRVVQTDQ